MSERTPLRVTHDWSFAAEANLAVDAVAQSAALSEQSERQFRQMIDRFVAFCVRGHGLESLGDVTAAVAAAFVGARSGRVAPALATQHLRRTWLRLMFRYARDLGFCAHDPTLDLRLPPRSGTMCRPMTDAEVALCRSAAIHSLTNTRRPAAWALAEATARSAEIPAVRIADLELEHKRVWIAGSARTEARWGQVSRWGALQLGRRVAELEARGASASTPVVYEGTGDAESKQASACLAVSDTLHAAGLGGERDVRPLSIVAWAGRSELERSGRIETVALSLGVRSLDRAARLISWDWHESSAAS